MRMWMLPPRVLCRQHLLGEHNELHKLLGCLRRGISLRGWLEQAQIFPSLMCLRHKQLVAEMFSRGYNHRSPMADPDELARLGAYTIPQKTPDIEANFEDLMARCSNCRDNARKLDFHV